MKIATLIIVASIIAVLFVRLLRHVAKRSTPVALAIAIVLAILIAPVMSAYAIGGALIIGMFYVAIVG